MDAVFLPETEVNHLICIYDRNATDFSANGICPLCPTSCEVSETLNGEYELKMEHALDDLGKWIKKSPKPLIFLKRCGMSMIASFRWRYCM